MCVCFVFLLNKSNKRLQFKSAGRVFAPAQSMQCSGQARWLADVNCILSVLLPSGKVKVSCHRDYSLDGGVNRQSFLFCIYVYLVWHNYKQQTGSSFRFTEARKCSWRVSDYDYVLPDNFQQAVSSPLKHAPNSAETLNRQRYLGSCKNCWG